MRFRSLLFIAISLALVGCSGGSLKNLYQSSARLAQKLTTSSDGPLLRQDYRYLKVRIKNREALVVFGEVESSFNLEQQIWFSRDRNILATFGGRIMRTSGLEINVVETRFISMPPAWEDIRERTTYFRSRDFMPQYQFGIIEEVEIRRLSSPPSRLTLNKNNRYILNKEIIWFEESFKNEAGTIYSYFGFQKSEEGLRPVVSVQCLAKNFCLELESVESRGT